MIYFSITEFVGRPLGRLLSTVPCLGAAFWLASCAASPVHPNLPDSPATETSVEVAKTEEILPPLEPLGAEKTDVATGNRDTKAPRSPASGDSPVQPLPPAQEQAESSAAASLRQAANLIQQGKFEDADQVLERLAAKAPNNPRIRINQATLLAAEGNLSQAAMELEETLKKDLTYGVAFENLLRIYEQLADASGPEGSPARTNVSELFFFEALGTGAGPGSKVAVLKIPAAMSNQNDAGSRTAGFAAATSIAAVATNSPASLAPSDSAQVVDMVHGWSKAWSNQDVGEYLRYYAPEFNPDSALTREAWERQRVERISSPEFIEVKIAILGVEMTGEDRASVRFLQDYISDRYEDSVRKQMNVVKIQGQWQIAEERNEP